MDTPTEDPEYVSAGLDEAARYARFVRESLDDQFDTIRSMQPPTEVPAAPQVPPGSMWAGVPTISAEVARKTATVHAALAARVVKNAEALGIAVPPDIARKAEVPG